MTYRSVFIGLLVCCGSIAGHAQMKLAQYAYGTEGTDQFEHFAFWTKDGERSKIVYSYGKNANETKLRYAGKAAINGDSCFKVQFANNYMLYIIAAGQGLKVVDPAQHYNKVFSWQYEGPVDGVGTFCEPCAADEKDAMGVLQKACFK